jgi:hypothetical protein
MTVAIGERNQDVKYGRRQWQEGFYGGILHRTLSLMQL